MGKKTEMDIERAKQEMTVAHEKKMAAIDRIAGRVRTAEVSMHDKKMMALDKAAERVASLREAALREAALREAALRGAEVKAAAGETVAAAGDAAGKARVRLQQQPWIVALAASVLFLALGVSVGRRYFSPG